MRIRWTPQALNDLDKIFNWLSTIEGALPDRTLRRIHATAHRLASYDVGRPSRIAGQREISVRDAPYVIVYEIDGEHIDLIAVFHTSQKR